MRVALVHDDLVQWGGAERVLEGICEVFPEAPIYTSVFDHSNLQIKKRFGHKKIYTSFLQNIPRWRFFYKALLPYYPIAFEQFNFDEYDLVISHTTRFAKSIITKPETKHFCYCHTPPRFLWHLSGEGSRGLLEIMLTKLRIYDQITSNRVDFFIAGSKNAANRINKIYRRESKILYPFIDLERFKNIITSKGEYFLAISRPNKYKKIELVKKACSKLNLPLKVISGGLEDKDVVGVLANCKALIIAAIEDFGLTSLEAQALGKPVIAYRAGGSLETIIEGQTGYFFDEQTIESLTECLEKFEKNEHPINPEECIKNAKNYSKKIFIRNFKQTIATL